MLFVKILALPLSTRRADISDDLVLRKIMKILTKLNKEHYIH